MARKALLVCGILTSLLYLATDVLGGLAYPGYDFAAQAISELGAIGAPSRPLVGPLLVAYNVLMLAFGIGVLREAGGGRRALWGTGACLIACAAIGFATTALFPSFFSMRRPGSR
jgi:hypothetical membrane protein